MKYSIYYSKFKKLWLIVNNETKLAHSFYKSINQARQIARDLERF